jgi:hypothetical protein
MAAFGIASDELLDDAHSFCDARAIAHYRLRLSDLQKRCDPITLLLGERTPSVFTAVSVVRDLVTSPSPFVTLCSARFIRAAMLDAFDRDAPHTQRLLAEAWKDGEKEWVSFERLGESLRRAEVARSSPTGTERQYALAVVEAYKRMVEGLTRRWVNLLLQLTGLDEPIGTVGRLGQPAVARLGDLGDRIQTALIPAVRNADAHDDFTFDEATGLICLDGPEFHPDEIAGRLSELDVLQRAFILGRQAALADQPDLAGAVVGSPVDLQGSSALAFARQRFGHAGQQIRSFRRDRDRLDVVIDDLRSEACNPCFVALTQTAQVLPDVSRFLVSVPRVDEPVIDVLGSVLHENFKVFLLAASHFPDGLPQATFLPSLTWARLSCESKQEAARAAAWLALNDGQHAINDAEASHRELKRLRERLAVVIAATSATIRILPEGRYLKPIHRARRILVASAGVLDRRDPYGVVLDRILGVRDQLGPPPPVLPMLDPTPLTEQNQYPHPAS